MQKWIITGISGSGRIELANEIKDYATSIGKKVMVHDVGELIQNECTRNSIGYTDQRILDLDISL